MDPRLTFISLFSVSFLTCYIGTQKLNKEERVFVPVVVEIQPTQEEFIAPPIVEAPLPIARDEAEARLLVFQGERPLLALQDVYEKEWLQGDPEWLSKKQPFELKGSINADMLPSSTAAWVGQRVNLYRADGTFCTAEVTQLSLFGQLNSYNEEQPGDAKDVWELTQNLGGVRIVGELSLDSCEGAIFARLASLPALEISQPQKPTTVLQDKIIAAGRALSLYQNIQREFESVRAEEKYEEPLWDNLYEAKPQVHIFSLGKEQLALLSIEAGEACGSFSGSLFAFWRVSGEQMTLLYQSKTWANPELLFDLNQDGAFEFIENQQLFRLHDSNFEPTTNSLIPDDADGCGC